MNQLPPLIVRSEEINIHEIVLDAVAAASVGLQAHPTVLELETCIYGGSGFMDSVGLVSLLLEIERQLEEKCGMPIPIMDDKAFSKQYSPFRSVGSLEHYVAQRVKDVCAD